MKYRKCRGTNPTFPKTCLQLNQTSKRQTQNKAKKKRKPPPLKVKINHFISSFFSFYLFFLRKANHRNINLSPELSISWRDFEFLATVYAIDDRFVDSPVTPRWPVNSRSFILTMKSNNNNNNISHTNNKHGNGLIPNSLKFISSCIKTASSGVRSAGASVAASISGDTHEHKDQVQ